MKRRVALAWSGGKDSALALWALRQDLSLDVVSLLTTATLEDGVVPMHEVPLSLIERQAEAADLPLFKVLFPRGGDNATYEKAMGDELRRQSSNGVTAVAFGDLFLDDIRNYREKNLRQLDLDGLFPLWGRDTRDLIREFVDAGFESVLTCVDLRRLPESFVGRAIDGSFVADLPADVDPCGENGEYHSFCHRGPIFKNEIQFAVGASGRRGDFAFAALRPV